jgi:hypothetical protein
MAATRDQTAEAPPAPERTDPPPTERTAKRAPLAVAAAVTTLWAALVSLVPVTALVVLVQFVGGGQATTGAAIRAGLAGWLLAHGVPLHIGDGTVALTPLLFTVFAAWRVARAGVHTTRAVGGSRRGSPRLVGLIALAVGAAYALIGLIAGLFAALPGLHVDVLRAPINLFVFGCVAGGLGALKESRGHARLARRTPMPVRDATRTGLVAALLVVGAGAAIAGTSLAVSGGAASKVLALYHAGIAGQTGLTLLCIVYGPNLAVWSASYLIGPGFTLGTGTLVSAGQVSLGAVPALPVLAAVPAKPAADWLGLLLAVPLAAGMAAGWLLARRRIRRAAAAAGRAEATPVRPDPAPAQPEQGITGTDGAGTEAPSVPRPRRGGEPVGWVPLLGAAALAGPVAGAALAAAAWASSGSLGDGRLADVGPHPWPLAVIAAGLVAAGAVVAAGATKALITR